MSMYENLNGSLFVMTSIEGTVRQTNDSLFEKTELCKSVKYCNAKNRVMNIYDHKKLKVYCIKHHLKGSQIKLLQFLWIKFIALRLKLYSAKEISKCSRKG